MRSLEPPPPQQQPHTHCVHDNTNNNQQTLTWNVTGSARRFEQQHILPRLSSRQEKDLFRRLIPFHQPGSIDFSSNDYLGLAQSQMQHDKVSQAYNTLFSQQQKQQQQHQEGTTHAPILLGSTGSRLLTGDSDYAHSLERRLAQWHNRSAALLCNSGYDANLSVLSCMTLNSIVIMDELAHNSMQMGVRMSKDCSVSSFRHNCVHDLKRKLEQTKELGSSSQKPVLVVVESVYSMDGDVAPLQEILDLAQSFEACVIVDEAHGLGISGKNGMGVLERESLENHPALLCSIHTFGKAAGCHGAVVCGSQAIKDYLLNYGRPIIYSTSLPIHSLVAISCAYESMSSDLGENLRGRLYSNITTFRQGMESIMSITSDSIGLVASSTPIQALIIPGNRNCVNFCFQIWKASNETIRLYPIRSPTVMQGHERVRIVIHAHNTREQISYLLKLIEVTLAATGCIRDDTKNSKL